VAERSGDDAGEGADRPRRETAGSQLEDLLADARVAELVTDRELESTLGRAPRSHAGAAELRALLTREEGRAETRSRMERRFLKLIRAADLPVPLTNMTVCGFRVDFFWPELKLILELDGYRFHRSHRSFERDRRKAQILKVRAGHDVLRDTWRQLDGEPVAPVATVAQAIAVARAAA
jgi:very-short-patch-repair endonuclease